MFWISAAMAATVCEVPASEVHSFGMGAATGPGGTSALRIGTGATVRASLAADGTVALDFDAGGARLHLYATGPLLTSTRSVPVGPAILLHSRALRIVSVDGDAITVASPDARFEATRTLRASLQCADLQVDPKVVPRAIDAAGLGAKVKKIFLSRLELHASPGGEVTLSAAIDKPQSAYEIAEDGDWRHVAVQDGVWMWTGWVAAADLTPEAPGAGGISGMIGRTAPRPVDVRACKKDLPIELGGVEIGVLGAGTPFELKGTGGTHALVAWAGTATPNEGTWLELPLRAADCPKVETN